MLERDGESEIGKVHGKGSGVWGGAVAWLLGGRHVRPCDRRSRLQHILYNLYTDLDLILQMDLALV